MKASRLNLFRKTVFGPWLDIGTVEHDNHLINYLLQHQRYIENPPPDKSFYFDFGQHTLEFSQKDFCLLTGLRFGNCSLKHYSKRESEFKKRVFPDISRVKGDKIKNLILDDSAFSNLTDKDAVRVCLLFALNWVFMGLQLRGVVSEELFNLVENIDSWNNFPWGEYMWDEFHNRVYNNDRKYRKDHLDKKAALGATYLPTYTLQGFVFPLKVWLLEKFPVSRCWWSKKLDVLPRCVAWSDVKPFSKSDSPILFDFRNPIYNIEPTNLEKTQPWWIASLEYFKSGSRLSLSTEKSNKRTRYKRKSLKSPKKSTAEITSMEVDVDCIQHGSTSSGVVDISKEVADLKCEFNDRIRNLELICSSPFTNHVDKVDVLQKISQIKADFKIRLAELDDLVKNPLSGGHQKENDDLGGSTLGSYTTAFDGVDLNVTDLNGNHSMNENHNVSENKHDLLDNEKASSPFKAKVMMEEHPVSVNENKCSNTSEHNEGKEACKDMEVDTLKTAEVEDLSSSKSNPSTINDPNHEPLHNEKASSPFNGKVMMEEHPVSVNENKCSNTSDHNEGKEACKDMEVDTLKTAEVEDFSSSKSNASTINHPNHESLHNEKASSTIDSYMDTDSIVPPNTEESPLKKEHTESLPNHNRFSKDELNQTKDGKVFLSNDYSCIQDDLLVFENTQTREMSCGYVASQTCILSDDTKGFYPTEKLDELDFGLADVLLDINCASKLCNNQFLSDENLADNADQIEDGSSTMDQSVNNANDSFPDVALLNVDEQPALKSQREVKLSKFRKDPFITPPESSQPKPKVRARTKKLKKFTIPLIGPDNHEIPEWSEDLWRTANAPRSRPLVPKYIMDLIISHKDKEFYFPWGPDSITVKAAFWGRLLGIGRGRDCWLSDTHLELWILYLCHYRLPDADYILHGPFFHTSIFTKETRSHFVSGVTYGVPWSDDGVEKVYFPINEDDIHWVLAQLHLRSGVITIYDSMLPNHLLETQVEYRKWWLGLAETYQYVIPKYLEDNDVMSRKGIDPKNYTITFRYAANVPTQAGPLGDCGIWVMRNLFMLTKNMELEVTNPLLAGLAYRERFADFFWTYKIPTKCANNSEDN